MKRDDWMLLLLTFLTGIAIGMYVYVMFFKPTYLAEEVNSTEEMAREWSIIGEKRTGSDSGNSSFRLLADGSYTYIPGVIGSDAKEGKLNSSLMREIRTYDSVVGRYESPISNSSCRSNMGDADYRYTVTISNNTYILDTCYTTLSYDSELSLLLDEIWQEIEGRNKKSYDSFADWLEDWIRQNIGFESDS